nr:hypothetical protein BaRGS_000405 [Batillaria attramentaria]
MARGMTANELSQAQMMALQMAQAEAALHQANYLAKAHASLSARSKAERDFHLAMSTMMPWPPRPDLLNPFHHLTQQHLLAQQQQQMQQQQREKEREKEREKQKQREREQQQKREREREREKQQQLKQEQLELRHHQQKLIEQQHQYKQKQLQMLQQQQQQQQRKLDAAHSQFQRDVAKRSFEAMAGGSLGAGEQPRKAHTGSSEAKKARLPGSYPPTTPPSGKPRPSHTKENGGSSKSSSTSSHNSLNLPVPIPVSPVAPPRMWSSCFPYVLPPPTIEMARLSRFFSPGEEAAAAQQSKSASSSSSSSTVTASSSAGSAGGSATGASSSGGEALDLSVSRR